MVRFLIEYVSLHLLNMRLTYRECGLNHCLNKKAPGAIFRAEGLREAVIRYLVARAAIATAATTAAIFAGLGFIDVQRPSAQVFAVKLLNGSSAFFLR